MSQKTRLAIETSPSGFVMRCAGCIARIEPSSPIYSDLDSDDDFCVKCGGYFVERKFAIVVAAPLFLNPLDKSTS